ncbi:UDP-N-acetylmuramate:L-alanyl-gamma-D-glutamyl-meso-diaminopimelate ligase [Wenzhouxiangella sp. AB-CW3]|uniref:UDP-N-acetylmuramate:L-alanyl-gamma-D-glutamyl- meso-diaminopimelate ligase n=1 Tax=Wenzhouxiangella sp. AB-CW3 TaxID=2771012 RepID=UPI00168AA8AE|nr:UDP-N-acetylmuramate:L-alanyl-gamma-D-glutamyl-meso-diaminopimelate ligase [Wenzhouxiangella sp. AB-CW3]QOC22823.1 UDP-N-acetylmuramate:L-alanyl-gamma-D-glutamyl-meso-diaminopimelate ligase [Wenzhouxiangella sp. AB-CW3]
MKIHILGICGTFMGGVAALARADGHEVSGSDQNVYPPMSTQLEQLGIDLAEGYRPEHIAADTDLVIVGNALGRGNPAVEHILNENIPFTSGPRWLGENYLRRRKVLAVAGTHGKTTTASMLAWILEQAGLAPGFLIGGIPTDFGVSARAGEEYFVVEADEYDTAFFDKRAKFVHYRPRIAILNNLEFDHADIYPDLASIQTQFHHLVRTIAGNGSILVNAADSELAEVLDMGCWTRQVPFGFHDSDSGQWQVRLIEPSGRRLEIFHQGESQGELNWTQTGRHNALNALAAIAAAGEAGVPVARAIEALARFGGVKRRLERLGECGGVHVYDDFAHHPTAIRLTLEGLRRAVGNARILVALEPASNTMRGGFHVNELPAALAAADHVWLRTSEAMDWDPHDVLERCGGEGRPRSRVEALLDDLAGKVRPGDHVVFMSNRGFESAPQRFFDRLA